MARITPMTIMLRRSPSFSYSLTFYCSQIKMFQINYKFNFDDRKYRCDAVVNKKSYNTNQNSEVEIQIENIVKLASKQIINKAKISLV